MSIVQFSRVFSEWEQSLAQAVFVDLQDLLGSWEQATTSLGGWGRADANLTRVLQASAWSDKGVATLHWLIRDDDQMCFLTAVMAAEQDLLDMVSHWLSLAGFSTTLSTLPQEFGPVRSAGWYDLVAPNRVEGFAGSNVSPRGATLVGGRAMMPSRVLLSPNPKV